VGMFDKVYLSAPLPDGLDPAGLEFQTKDLECLFDEYTITDEGRLTRQIVEYEPNPDYVEPPALPEQHTFENLLDRLDVLRTATREAKRYPLDVNYHGWLEFHVAIDTGEFVTYTRPGGLPAINKQYDYRSYRAKFTDGQLQHIEVGPPD
jgi:hypothetical protein